jgi:hypothetical protein
MHHGQGQEIKHNCSYPFYVEKERKSEVSVERGARSPSLS